MVAVSRRAEAEARSPRGRRMRAIDRTMQSADENLELMELVSILYSSPPPYACKLAALGMLN